MIGTVLVLPLVLVGIGFLLAPSSEVRSQQAVEADKDRELARDPALLEKSEPLWDSGSDGWTWVFPRRVTDADLAPAEALFYEGPGESEAASRAVRQAGGIRTATHCGRPVEGRPRCWAIGRYKVTLTGNRQEPVQIDDIRARVLSERKAPLGTLLLSPPQGGGPVDTVFIDLDSPDKLALALDEDNDPTTRPFVDVRNRFAEEGEPLKFEVMAGTTRQATYRWELIVTVSYGDRTEKIRVPREKNASFRTVGWDADWSYARRYDNDLSRGEFSRTGP